MDVHIYDLNATLEFRRRHRAKVRLDRKRRAAKYAAKERDNVARYIDAEMDAAIRRDDELEEKLKRKNEKEKQKENIKTMTDWHIQYEEKGGFSMAPSGQYQAVCVEILDYGFVTKTYTNRETNQPEDRTFRQGQFVFQLNKLDESTGKRFEIRSKKLNMSSLHEKSGLRQFLTQWRGHDLTDQEMLPPGLNIGGLVGRNAQIQVIHVAGTKEGTKFANIGSIMPLMDGMPVIEALNYESQQSKVTARQQQEANPTTHTGQGEQPNAASPAAQAAGGDGIPF